ncbi:hypothetical protein C8J57DRAFT_1247632 [Mycena rebaudengoi]|nr:hypothetical protein C8J57DRAFT_1247628 [Mycena rebaudengoi]KAJ7236646.1 hypothetical protein C8J57DRAFT_1247632 [Mycena rebaudengoi]
MASLQKGERYTAVDYVLLDHPAIVFTYDVACQLNHASAYRWALHLLYEKIRRTWLVQLISDLVSEDQESGVVVALKLRESRIGGGTPKCNHCQMRVSIFGNMSRYFRVNFHYLGDRSCSPGNPNDEIFLVILMTPQGLAVFDTIAQGSNTSCASPSCSLDSRSASSMSWGVSLDFTAATIERLKIILEFDDYLSSNRVFEYDGDNLSHVLDLEKVFEH